LYDDALPIFNSSGSKFTEEKTSVIFVPETRMLNDPFSSAVTALSVPLSETVAPGTGAPTASLTVPVTVRSWEKTKSGMVPKRMIHARNFSFCISNFLSFSNKFSRWARLSNRNHSKSTQKTAMKNKTPQIL
jgi:hypothetical protein